MPALPARLRGGPTARWWCPQPAQSAVLRPSGRWRGGRVVRHLSRPGGMDAEGGDGIPVQGLPHRGGSPPRLVRTAWLVGSRGPDREPATWARERPKPVRGGSSARRRGSVPRPGDYPRLRSLLWWWYSPHVRSGGSASVAGAQGRKSRVGWFRFHRTGSKSPAHGAGAGVIGGQGLGGFVGRRAASARLRGPAGTQRLASLLATLGRARAVHCHAGHRLVLGWVRPPD